MANKTVLDFLAVTSTDPADVLYLIRGTGAGRDKKITWANLTANLLDKTYTGASTIAGSLTLTSGAIPLTIERPTAAMNSITRAITIGATSLGDMVDGFSAAARFTIKDTALVVNEIGLVSFARDGADNSGKFALQIANAGTLADRFTVDKTGVASASDSIALLGQTASRVPYLDANKKLVSSSVTNTELGYLAGVTSALQTQLNGKAPTSHASTATTYGIGDATNYGHVRVDATPTDGSANAVASNAVFDALAGKEDGYPTYTWNNSGPSTYWWNCLVFAVSRASDSTQAQGGLFQFYTFGGTSAAAGSMCEVLIELKSQNGGVSYTAQMTKGSSTSRVRINYYEAGDGYNYLHVIPYVYDYAYTEMRVIKNEGYYAINPSGAVTNSYTGVLYPIAPTPAAGDESIQIANTAWGQGEFLHKPAGSVEVWNIATIPVFNPSDADKNKAYGLVASTSGNANLSNGTMSVGGMLYVFGNSPNLGSSLELGINYANPAGVPKRVTVSRASSGPFEASGVLFIRYGGGWMPVGGNLV